MMVTLDAGLYSYQNLRAVINAGADALFRAGSNVGLPVLGWLPDGSYLSFAADPDAKRLNSYRLRKGLVKITDLPGIPVRLSITRSRTAETAMRYSRWSPISPIPETSLRPRWPLPTMSAGKPSLSSTS